MAKLLRSRRRGWGRGAGCGLEEIDDAPAFAFDAAGAGVGVVAVEELHGVADIDGEGLGARRSASSLARTLLRGHASKAARAPAWEDDRHKYAARLGGVARRGPACHRNFFKPPALPT